MVISNAIGLKECAIAAMGLALLPDGPISQDLKAGRLINILSDYNVSVNFDTSV